MTGMSDENRWDREWRGREVIDDIRMKDFFSGRQYICKFFPWWGRAVEAGCGLGRYVFYFTSLGREIVGVDFSPDSIVKARRFSGENGFDPKIFVEGNIEDLHFGEGSFSYYISLGVLEHFQRGPEKALREAYRVLAPGGLLLVTTPNKYSLEVVRGSVKYGIKRLVNGRGTTPAMFSSDADGRFFQYWYSRAQMSGFITGAGFVVVEESTMDLRYPLFQKMKSSAWPRLLWNRQHLINTLEGTPLRMFGGNTVIVAMKPGKEVHCFFCGDLTPGDDLNSAGSRVPACRRCRTQYSKLMVAYAQGTSGRYTNGRQTTTSSQCSYCGKPAVSHSLFGNHGFDRITCSGCMHTPGIRGELFSQHVQLSWKPYQAEN